MQHPFLKLTVLLHSNKPISNWSWPMVFNESLERFGIAFRHYHTIYLRIFLEKEFKKNYFHC